MTGNRWLARLALLLIAAAIAILIAFAGVQSLALVLIGALGPGVMLAGAYWFLSNKGLVRWLAFALAVLAPAAVIVAYARRDILWVAIAAVVALILALISARAAIGSVVTTPAERPAEPPKRPFLIMNPRSGGGKVARFKLKERAESLGAEIALLEGPDVIDVAALARQAVANGADLLGVAGGDGTQALVAGIAAEHDLPYVCISAGTRNHFAMDLGLDRDDPARCLDALTDGVEQRIDLGRIGDRTFVNNASFGAYAELVRSPAYRNDKRGTALQMLPDLLKGGDGNSHRLSALVSGTQVDGPQAILVSNNTYQTTDIAGLGHRTGLAGGTLGVVAITVDNAAQAVGLVRRGHGSGLRVLAATEVTVEAMSPEIPVGIDGEMVMMPTPVRCTIVPGALRVVVPRNRPGAQPRRQQFSWRRLWQLAGVRRLTDDRIQLWPRMSRATGLEGSGAARATRQRPFNTPKAGRPSDRGGQQLSRQPPPNLPVVPAPAHHATRGSEQHEDEADQQQCDPDRPQNRDFGDDADDEKDDTEDDHDCSSSGRMHPHYPAVSPQTWPRPAALPTGSPDTCRRIRWNLPPARRCCPVHALCRAAVATANMTGPFGSSCRRSAKSAVA